MSLDRDGLAGADWRKSRRSIGNGECVEVASAAARVLVRDSVTPSGAVIAYPPASWHAFVKAAKANAFDFSR
jgi:hypothetical protein